MAESVVLEARPRTERGTQAARRLRRQGLIPAVVYGHKEATISLILPLEAVEKAIRHGVRVVDLRADGKQEKVLIKEVQWDHLGKHLLHVDFTRVAVDERIEVSVPVELRGTAPGVNAGGILDQPIHTLSIECLAMSIPDSIRVNIGELQVGQAIHVRDLHLPEGIRVRGDPEAIIVHITTPVAPPEPVAAAEAPAQAEPEVIGRQKVEEEEGE
jgi:large subunit ribosomal protein L25